MSDASAQDAETRRAIARAGILEARGDYAQAAELYEEALSGLPADDALSLQTRQSLVDLYFDHQDIPNSRASLLAHIEALEEAGEVDKADRVNWRLAIALQQAMESGDVNTWEAAVAEVVPDAAGVRLSDRLLAYIDALMEQAAGEADSPELLGAGLNDLLLLSPDLESARRIQWRQIAWLESVQQWDKAIAACKLDILLGAQAEDGPSSAIVRCAGLMRSAQHSEEQIDAWLDRLYAGEGSLSLSDDALAAVASERLERWDAIAPYQAAVLYAMAGDQEQALESLVAMLAETGTAEGEIGRDLDRVAWVVCLVRGHWRGSNRLSAWMSLPESNRQAALEGWDAEAIESELVLLLQTRASALRQDKARGLFLGLPVRSQVALLRPLQQRAKTRLSQWIERAEQSNEVDAELAWRMLYLDLNPRVESQREVLRDWSDEKIASLGSENAEAWLERLSGRVERPELKEELVYSIAMLRYRQGRLEAATIAFDELLALDADDDARDDWQLARIIALAGLGQWDGAAAAIDALPMDTPGRLYAAGWLAARTNENERALARLRELRDRYPDSPEASSAVSLLVALEAAP